MTLERIAWGYLTACLVGWTVTALIGGGAYLDAYAPDPLEPDAGFREQAIGIFDFVVFTFQVLFDVLTFGILDIPAFIRIPLSISCGLSIMIAFGRPLLELVIKAVDAIVPF